MLRKSSPIIQLSGYARTARGEKKITTRKGREERTQKTEEEGEKSIYIFILSERRSYPT